MTQVEANSVAAILSFLLRALFWAAIVIGLVSAFTIVSAAVTGEPIPFPGDRGAELSRPAAPIAALIAISVFSGGIAFISDQLRRILSTLASGDPFVPENATRLMRIAGAIALVEIIRNIGYVLLVSLTEAQVDYDFHIGAWIAVVILFVLAQVFREGTRLREESQMTI
ncbi:MAG: DUF2975 domain-containing protein [Pseudomonadota bacterium]